MLLVTGAAGKTGRAVSQALATHGARVRAFVRRKTQAAVIQELGLQEVIFGDMGDADLFRRALQGIRAIYHICPNVSPQEVSFGRIAIDAAKSAGVAHFVYHSVLHPQTQAMPHHWQKMRVEEMLLSSGLNFTILQPAAYMQNVLGGWQSIVEEGIYHVPYPAETKIALVDLQDVAEVAAKVILEDAHLNATYELVGQADLTQAQVAQILGDRLKRLVRVERVPPDEWRRQAEATGLGAYQIDSLSRMFRYYEQFGLAGNSQVLAHLLSRRPTTFDEFVVRQLSSRSEEVV